MIRAPHLGVELTRLARSPRPHTIRILFVGVLIGLAVVIWPWWQAELNELRVGSAQIFQVFFWAEMALAVFVVPALVAPAIPAEREAGTLELLVMCPEPEGHLVLGKMAAQVVFIGGILAAGFPLAFASTLLGGVPLGRAAGACVHIAMTAAFASCVALRCSLAWRGAAAASLAAVFIHAAIIFGSLALAWFVAVVLELHAYKFFAIVVGSFATVIWLRWRFTGTAPTGCLGCVGVGLVAIGVALAFAGAALPGRRPGVSMTMHAICPWLAYAHDAKEGRRLPWAELVIPWAVQAIACTLLLRGSSLAAGSGRLLLGPESGDGSSRLYGPLFRSEWREKKARDEEALRPAVNKRERIQEPPRKLALHPRGNLVNMARENPFLPVGNDPVYWKETSWMRFPSLNKLRMIAVVTAWLCAAAGALEVGWTNTSSWLLQVELALLIALLVAATGTTIAEERESGTLAVLLSTGYPSRRIVLGKARAALRWCFPLIIPVALHLLFAIAFLGSAGSGAAFVFAATALSVLGIGIATSAFSRRPRFAFGGTMLALIALWTFPSLFAMRWPEEARHVLLNPFAALGEMLSLSARRTTADPQSLAVFAAASLALAILLPMLAAFRLERLVRA